MIYFVYVKMSPALKQYGLSFEIINNGLVNNIFLYAIFLFYLF